MTMITLPPAAFCRDLSDYDDIVALGAAEHAVAVYQEPDEYGFACLEAGFEGGTIIEDGPAQVGVAWSPGIILVSPRGSDEGLDWLGNFASVFRLGWRPFLPRGCRAGLGFRSQAKRIARKLFDRLRFLRARYPDAIVIIGGHSLGAALVPLLVAYLAHRHMAVDAAYMLEPPRPGDRDLADWYDREFTEGATPTYTVINVEGGESDLVTRVPLKRMGARHLGRCVIHSDGEIHRGWDAWQEHREANPVGYLKAWRVISRTIAAVRAHLGKRLLRVLRARAER